VGSLVKWLGFADIVFVELAVDEDLSHFLGRGRGFCRGREISCEVMLRELLTAILSQLPVAALLTSFPTSSIVHDVCVQQPELLFVAVHPRSQRLKSYNRHYLSLASCPSLLSLLLSHNTGGNMDTVKPRYKDTQYRIHLLAPQGLILLCATPRWKDTSVYP
jgi:hypothetical protein